LGTRTYAAGYGFEECPNVSEPCGGDGSASCANLIIGPITLESNPFPSECLKIFDPFAAVGIRADNFGFAFGQIGEVGCPPSNACVTCSESGTVTPFIENAGDGQSIMTVTAFAQNAPHGGPYSLNVSATFWLA
jgi:hypothetical protein